MKTISAAFKTHLAQEVTTLATCWKLARTDGTIMGFTDTDQPIIYTDNFGATSQTVTYKASTGAVPSSVNTPSDGSVPTLEIVSVLDAAAITEQDLAAGLYDYAAVVIFQVNYADLTMGAMILRAGYIGEVSRHRNSFRAELRGKSQALQQPIGELYLPTCRYDFGDSRCTVALGPITVTGAVTAVSDAQNFTDSGRGEATKKFQFGLLTWTSGNNNGRSMEVKVFTAGGVFQLTQAMPRAIQVGDTYSVYPGCNKNLVDPNGCSGFSNQINFGGFPYVPGIDKLLKYPNAH